MLGQIILDGPEITTLLQSIVASIVAVLLQIMSGIFAVVLEWLLVLIGGTFLSNPAPFLIGFLFMLTAWKVHTSGQ